MALVIYPAKRPSALNCEVLTSYALKTGLQLRKVFQPMRSKIAFFQPWFWTGKVLQFISCIWDPGGSFLPNQNLLYLKTFWVIAAVLLQVHPIYKQYWCLESFHQLQDADWHHPKMLHPGRLTWNLQITHLERKMIFQTSVIRIHVNLQGCTPCSQSFAYGKSVTFTEREKNRPKVSLPSNDADIWVLYHFTTSTSLPYEGWTGWISHR